jgi:hypothetical protein
MKKKITDIKNNLQKNLKGSKLEEPAMAYYPSKHIKPITSSRKFQIKLSSRKRNGLKFYISRKEHYSDMPKITVHLISV